MGCARHCALLTTPIFDQADKVAGVMVLAGKEQKAGGMASQPSSVPARKRQLLQVRMASLPLRRKPRC